MAANPQTKKAHADLAAALVLSVAGKEWLCAVEAARLIGVRTAEGRSGRQMLRAGGGSASFPLGSKSECVGQRLRVTVGVLKSEDTPFAMQFGQQRARLCAAARAALQMRP